VTKRVWAILAATLASTIYGINHTLAKGLMPDHILPKGFILLRVLGAAVLFWGISFFVKTEKIDRKDWPRIVLCTVCGMVINMVFFFEGLNLSTPINSSVIITLSPIVLFVLSAIFIREKITIQKSVGAFIGLLGALLLVFFTVSSATNAPNIPLGNMFFIINVIAYSVYLIVVRPLTAKYSSITLMKWFFMFAVLINLPLGFQEFRAVSWSGLPFDALWKMGFVVVGTTFMTYLLNIYALKELSASTLGVFIYLQPVLGIAYAILVGADELDFIKILSMLLVFVGVYVVSVKPTRKRAKRESP
jgi:drug/metabolite transporter (DMT)-like permease